MPDGTDGAVVAQVVPNSPADPKATLNFCRLFGTTVPFEKATLSQLYPTHDSFVKPFDKAVDSIEKAGFWLKPEADEAKKAADASGVGR